jgi:hypothetical protein
MKKTIQAVLFTASLLALVSCDQTSKQAKANNPFIGQWKIDSLSATDSNNIGIMLLAMTLKDSAIYDLSFTADSMKLHQKDTITSASYSIDTNQKRLLFKDDSTIFSYQQIDAAYIKLTAKDSLTVFLKKK